MSLIDILYDAVDSISGAQLAGLIGTDGLSIEMVLAEEELLPHDRAVAEAELSMLAAAASSSASRLGVGLVNDITLEADYLTYLISMVTPGYYAVLGVDANSNLGRARFAVRQIVSRLQEEL